jgi:hypothetical protein
MYHICMSREFLLVGYINAQRLWCVNLTFN